MGLEDLIPLAPGEFSAADKLQPSEHLAGRLDALRRFHLSDPALAQEVISYAFPNPQNRAWTQEELSQKLGLPPEPVRRIRKKKAEVAALGRFGLKVAEEDAGLGPYGAGVVTGAIVPPSLGALALAPTSAALAHFALTEEGKRRLGHWRHTVPLGLGALGLAGLGTAYHLYRKHHPTEPQEPAEPKVANLLHSITPSLGAAFDAFQAEREHQQLMQAMEDQQHYPAMSLTQPMMAQYAMGSGTDVAPPVHHHRHRHHHG